MFNRAASAIDFVEEWERDAKAELETGMLSLETFWRVRWCWSQKTFGPRHVRGPLGPARHLLKEVKEELLPLLESELESIGADDAVRRYAEWRAAVLEELVDCEFLVGDAVNRMGFSLAEFRMALTAKLVKNRARAWPTTSPTEPVEHVRDGEGK